MNKKISKNTTISAELNHIAATATELNEAIHPKGDKKMTKNRIYKFALLAIFAGFFLSVSVKAATITVMNTNDSGAGSLRQAIVDAAAGDTIVFDATVFATPQTIDLSSGQLFIDKSLTITGTGPNVLTLRNTSPLGYYSRVFEIAGGTVNLSGMTITGGNLIGSSGSGGGGITNSSILTLTNGIISGNSSYSYGGIFNEGTLTLVNSTVSSNSGNVVGGIENRTGTLTLNNSTVSGNTGSEAGGIRNYSVVTLTGSTVFGNGGFAGGIYNIGTLTLNNSTVSGNFNPGLLFSVGGIINQNALKLTNSTVSGNQDGDIWMLNDYGAVGTIRNSIINHCLSTTRNRFIINAEFSLFNEGIGCVNGTNTSNLTGDPLLGPLQDNGGPTFTHALPCSSAAINAGSNALAVDASASALTTDQRGSGFERVYDATVDMGAFERQESCNTAPAITASAVSRQQAAGSSNSTIATVGDANQSLDSLEVTADSGSTAMSNGVTVSNIAVNSAGAVTADVSAACAASEATFTLIVTDNGALFSEAMLTVTVTNETTPPVIDPISNVSLYLPLNSSATSTAVTFPLPGATDNCTDVPTVTTSPASGSTFNVGTTTVNVTAKDALNNTSLASFSVTVSFNYTGFFAPADNLPVVNIAAAGSAIPIKFSLSGNKGLAIFAAGYPVSGTVACDANEPGSTIEETVNAGGSSLTYDAASDRYNYVWKTNKAWKGTCRILAVRLIDGTDHYAKFRFK